MTAKISPIKLFIVRPTLGQGGADRVTLLLLQLLDRRRYQPALVLTRLSGEFLPDAPDDIPIYNLNSPNVAFSWPPLARLLRRERPDILFSTSSGTNVPAVIARRIARAPTKVILSERNTVYHTELTAKRRLVVWFKKRFYEAADQITAVSEGVKQDMVEKLGLDPDRIQVVYNPVVTDDMLRQAREPLDHPWFQPGEPPVVLAAGRMVKQKDFVTLIRAFAQARQSVTARLVILGEGPLQSALADLANSLGVRQDVDFPGFDKNPFRYMSRCSLYVLSSLHEGLPGVLIQAMACGAPVIATDCPYGPAEIIMQNGRDGFLIPVGDIDALAEKIRFLITHPEQRQTMAAMGRESAQRFRAEAALARYTAAIEGTI